MALESRDNRRRTPDVLQQELILISMIAVTPAEVVLRTGEALMHTLRTTTDPVQLWHADRALRELQQATLVQVGHA